MHKMKESKTRPTYDMWSRVYDMTFGPVVKKRQRRAISELRLKPGQRVLDLGVGTGVSLQFYPENVKVVGMDLSAGMLDKAQMKVDEEGYDHIKLVQADAMMPPFKAQSFDHVIITHVISVVSNPARLLEWAGKLVKPGGRVIVLNHFQSNHKVLGMLGKLFNPLFVKLGWRSDIVLSDCLRHTHLNVEYHFKLNPIDLWQIVVMSDSVPYDGVDNRREVVIEREQHLEPTHLQPAMTSQP